MLLIAAPVKALELSRAVVIIRHFQFQKQCSGFDGDNVFPSVAAAKCC